MNCLQPDRITVSRKPHNTLPHKVEPLPQATPLLLLLIYSIPFSPPFLPLNCFPTQSDPNPSASHPIPLSGLSQQLAAVAALNAARCSQPLASQRRGQGLPLVMAPQNAVRPLPSRCLEVWVEQLHRGDECSSSWRLLFHFNCDAVCDNIALAIDFTTARLHFQICWWTIKVSPVVFLNIYRQRHFKETFKYCWNEQLWFRAIRKRSLFF